jgi:hypothetical protein
MVVLGGEVVTYERGTPVQVGGAGEKPQPREPPPPPPRCARPPTRVYVRLRPISRIARPHLGRSRPHLERSRPRKRQRFAVRNTSRPRPRPSRAWRAGPTVRNKTGIESGQITLDSFRFDLSTSRSYSAGHEKNFFFFITLKSRVE